MVRTHVLHYQCGCYANIIYSGPSKTVVFTDKAGKIYYSRVLLDNEFVAPIHRRHCPEKPVNAAMTTFGMMS